MERKTESDIMSTIYTALNEEQMMGYLLGKTIEALADWNKSRSVDALYRAHECLLRMATEGALKNPVSSQVKDVSGYFSSIEMGINLIERIAAGAEARPSKEEK